MRLFIGLPLPGAMATATQAAQAVLKGRGAKGRWVEIQNLHLTLRFLGETDRMGQAAMAVRECVRGVRPISLGLAGVDFFRQGASKIAYASVSGDVGELTRLRESLEAELDRAGFGMDQRQFRPHITLGRKVELLEQRALETDGSVHLLDRVTLFESKSTAGGVEYVPLYTGRLTC